VGSLARRAGAWGGWTELEVLDDGQGFESLTQADTIGDDAAVVFLNLFNGTLYTVALELVEGTSDVRVLKSNLYTNITNGLLVADVLLKQVIERFEVDELWIMVFV
jgi:hypothetical protein